MTVQDPALVMWMLDPVLVQFPLDFTEKPEQAVTIRWDKLRTRKLDPLTPVKDLPLFKTFDSTTQYEGQKNPSPVTLRCEEPRVLAVLPADWLCESWIVGPQIPAEAQVTGREQYLADAKQQIDNVRDMQLSPPDQMNDCSPALRLHPDGSWRHSSEHHGDGEGFGSSIWMSTYLIDGIFQYWLLIGDGRCPDTLANYADPLRNYRSPMGAK